MLRLPTVNLATSSARTGAAVQGVGRRLGGAAASPPRAPYGGRMPAYPTKGSKEGQRALPLLIAP